MASVLSSEVKIGNIVGYNKGRYRILKRVHTKPGKGGAFYQFEMKEITHGTKLNERIRSEDKMERLETSVRPFQFLYRVGNVATLMNTEDFEQIEVDVDMFNGFEGFLNEDIELQCEYVDEDLVNIKMPINLEGEVAETEPHIKGAAVTSSYKTATLTNGFKVDIPPYIESGQKIIINSETGEFKEKA
jgi:elongation factor P